MEVSTTHYQFVHGRKPRGRGGWVFFFGHGRTHSFTSAGNMTFSEALRDAKAMARLGGHSRIEVGA